MNIASYIKETRGEMKHVSWPTRRQILVFTLTVIAASLSTALLLGLFDFIFSRSIGILVAPSAVLPTGLTETVPPSVGGAVPVSGAGGLPSLPARPDNVNPLDLRGAAGQ